MGIQSMIKYATGNTKNNDTSNPQTVRVWSRRVTEIAAALERSGDTANSSVYQSPVDDLQHSWDSNGLSPASGSTVPVRTLAASDQRDWEDVLSPLDRFAGASRGFSLVESDGQSWPTTHGDTAGQQTANGLPLPDSEYKRTTTHTIGSSNPGTSSPSKLSNHVATSIAGPTPVQRPPSPPKPQEHRPTQPEITTAPEMAHGNLLRDHANPRASLRSRVTSTSTPRRRSDLDQETEDPSAWTTVLELPLYSKSTGAPSQTNDMYRDDMLQSEPYLADRFGVKVPNLSDLVQRLDTGTVISGTYSTVYPGRYLNEKVAIKVLRMTKDNHTTQRKFRRELFIWWNLRHVNVLPLHGYFEDNHNGQVLPSLVSKWAECGSAAQYIHRDLSWVQRTRLLYDVTEGLKYLHGFEPLIVHADLKPQNVLVDKDGIGQLCDFGLTRFMQTGLDTGLTTTTAHTGTTRYLAYELVEYDGDEPIPTTATDMYALGCLGLEFIYRVPPHVSLRRNMGRIIRAIGDGVPPAKRPTIPEEVVPILWDLLEACWSTAPEERPTTAQVGDYLEKNIEELLEGLRHCTWAPEYLTS